MNTDHLLEEIRENRKEIQRLHKEFYIFKGKTFGFLSVLSVVVNLAFEYMFKK